MLQYCFEFLKLERNPIRSTIVNLIIQWCLCLRLRVRLFVGSRKCLLYLFIVSTTTFSWKYTLNMRRFWESFPKANLPSVSKIKGWEITFVWALNKIEAANILSGKVNRRSPQKEAAKWSSPWFRSHTFCSKGVKNKVERWKRTYKIILGWWIPEASYLQVSSFPIKAS
jgi:hypothetical protein